MTTTPTGQTTPTTGQQAPTGRKTPRAALFDLDGTLVDSEPRSRAAWAMLFAEHGVQVADHVLDAFAGRPGKEAIGAHLADFPGHTAEELFTEAMGYSRRPDMPGTRPVPGAVELLTRLHGDGVPMAVVTSATRIYAHGELTGLGVLGLFDVVLTADDVRRGKPDPEGYRRACARLGVRAEDAVVFEDAPAGVTAARKAGAYCVAVTVTQPPEALAEADLVLPDLTGVTWPVAL